MKLFFGIILGTLLAASSLAAGNVNFTHAIVFIGGDSRAANQGQPSWYPTLTNMCKNAGVTIFKVYIVAHNGDYLASSGGLMDEWVTEVQPFIDPSYFNLYIMDVGANHNDLEDTGGYTNYIRDANTFLIRGTNQGVHFGWLTLEENWRSTNAVFGVPYEINRGLVNTFVMTNTIIEYPVNNNPPYIDLPAYDWSFHVDNPPLHRNDSGSQITSTNIFLRMTTNAVPSKMDWIK